MAEYFLFAGLLFVTTLIFIVMSWFYKYVEPRPDESQTKEPVDETKEGYNGYYMIDIKKVPLAYDTTEKAKSEQKFDLSEKECSKF